MSPETVASSCVTVAERSMRPFVGMTQLTVRGNPLDKHAGHGPAADGSVLRAQGRFDALDQPLPQAPRRTEEGP
jgi:hypothetical protein